MAQLNMAMLVQGTSSGIKIADNIDLNFVNFNQDDNDKHNNINKNTNENEITNNNTKKSNTIFVSPIKFIIYWIYGDTLN